MATEQPPAPALAFRHSATVVVYSPGPGAPGGFISEAGEDGTQTAQSRKVTKANIWPRHGGSLLGPAGSEKPAGPTVPQMQLLPLLSARFCILVL